MSKSLRIRKDLASEMYFCTLTIRRWYYLFDRHNRFEILATNLAYCQKHKELKIYAFVFMLNHLHFIASAPNLGGVLRDFKSYTSKEFSKNICAFEPNILQLFETEKGFQFWKPGNAPKLIESDEFLAQKVEYIHQNPVQKQYVNYPEHWNWSSANREQSIVKVDSVDDFIAKPETASFNRDD